LTINDLLSIPIFPTTGTETELGDEDVTVSVNRRNTARRTTKLISLLVKETTKGCGSFMRSKSSSEFILKKVAAMGCSYRGLLKAGVVAVVFAMSVCSLTGQFR